jgi:hypothetical protein
MLTLLLLLFFLGHAPSQDPSSRFRLLVFEGSDWCRTCRSLERNVLSDSNFLNQLNVRSIQIQRVDFPQRKPQTDSILKLNRNLATRLGFKGQFPTLYLCRTDTFLFREVKTTGLSAEKIVKQLDQAILQMP